MARAGVGVRPGHVGLAEGVVDAAGDVEGLHLGVELGEAAIGLGELCRARDLNGGGHAERAVRGGAHHGEAARLLVKEHVHAGERNELLVAGGHEREGLRLLGEAEVGAEVGVCQEARRDALENAAHRLGRVAQDSHLCAAKDLRGNGPGRRPLPIGDGMGGRKVGRGDLSTLRVSAKVAHDAEILVLERATVKVAHGFLDSF